MHHKLRTALTDIYVYHSARMRKRIKVSRSWKSVHNIAGTDDISCDVTG